MGLYHFRLPDIGEGVAEAEVVIWHVKVGDAVREDQSLVDVMTDKATVDLTSPVDGTVLAVHGEIGGMMPVGSIIVEMEVEGEGNVAAGASQPARTAARPPEEEKREEAPASPPPPAPVAVQSTPAPIKRATSRRDFETAPFAAPATRRRARELGIPLQFVPGNGPGGRILQEDLDAYVASGGQPAAGHALVERHGVGEQKIIGLRRKIAEKMQDAKRRIPHIAYVEECDVTELEALRADLNAHRSEDMPKLTLLPFLIRAMARVLPDFPQINARFDDDAGVLHSHEGIHVGIATQTPAGLMVPVLRHAEARDLWDCARELSRVAAAARSGSATREELSGSTVTVTSLGTLGGIATTPVINHPEVAIIGPNKIVEKPVVQGAFISVRKVMNISSSFDHRIVDGYDAALFIQALKRYIEHPALIFMGEAA
ncbi:branched-chain alpha-keto acid dehydrogenase E2 component [Sphingobium sp. AP50]|uniref:dihydrolipoamide acetyltransferase family protein n=1 Tax=Sphingobium sp. AP50 TaxID=1884369 RepID=UPI0008B2F6E5|nr:dihydrolipoamide acetyltransferase family protein [Sphingobium sp. AP50]SEJ98522.1 branched-chain alpha-keto acid dehydrogenase E2 component [Sphingobium sp. AP50]